MPTGTCIHDMTYIQHGIHHGVCVHTHAHAPSLIALGTSARHANEQQSTHGHYFCVRWFGGQQQEPGEGKHGQSTTFLCICEQPTTNNQAPASKRRNETSSTCRQVLNDWLCDLNWCEPESVQCLRVKHWVDGDKHQHKSLPHKHASNYLIIVLRCYNITL